MSIFGWIAGILALVLTLAGRRESVQVPTAPTTTPILMAPPGLGGGNDTLPSAMPSLQNMTEMPPRMNFTSATDVASGLGPTCPNGRRFVGGCLRCFGVQSRGQRFGYKSVARQRASVTRQCFTESACVVRVGRRGQLNASVRNDALFEATSFPAGKSFPEKTISRRAIGKKKTVLTCGHCKFLRWWSTGVQCA